jgi:hypothetical protein
MSATEPYLSTTVTQPVAGVPDEPSEVITPEDRRAIRPDIDVAALERLLAHLPGRLREVVLALALTTTGGDMLYHAFVTLRHHPLTRRDRGAFFPPRLEDVHFLDDQLEAMLNEVLRGTGPADMPPNVRR